MDTTGLHMSNIDVDICTSLDNIENVATTDRGIVMKLYASNDKLAWTNATLTGQLVGLTAQIKVGNQKIQDMDTGSGKTNKSSRAVNLE